MCVCGVHVTVMDFEFLLRVAEKRIKAALGKSDAGKMCLCCVFFNLYNGNSLYRKAQRYQDKGCFLYLRINIIDSVI